MEKQKQGNGNGNGKLTLTRRDFLKTTAAAGAAGGLINLATGFDNALAVPATGTVDHTTTTTCACCSVGCGQLVDLDSGGNVIEVRGDPNHVTNRGGLCPKGSASVQWINGDRRLGTSSNVHGVTGPMVRTGDGSWSSISWDTAMSEIATAMVSARNADTASGAAATQGKVNNAKTVAFLGCSHATNEENYLYRKLIANFGTNNIEHQARI